MPKLQSRSNAMMSVKPTQPTQKVEEEKPEKPPINQQEEEIFNKEPKINVDENRRIVGDVAQNIDMTITPTPQEIHNEEVVEQVEEVVEPVKKKKEKKPCSDKLKAHLQRCREKSLATRRAKKEQKSKPIDIPKPAPTPQPQSHQGIDYERIISGVSNTLYSRFGFDEPQHQPPPTPTQTLRVQQPVQQQRQVQFQQQQVNHAEQQRKMLMDYEKKIREDERKRMKEEREKELSKTYKSKGMQVLKNGMPTHRKKDINIPNNGGNINPFQNAFGRRF